MDNVNFFELNFKLKDGRDARIVRTFDYYELWLPNPKKETGFDCISGNYDVVRNVLTEGKDEIFEFDTVLSLFEREKFYTGCMGGLDYTYYNSNNELMVVKMNIRGSVFIGANVEKIVNGVSVEITKSFYSLKDALRHIVNTYPEDAPMNIRRYLNKVLNELA